MHQESQNNGSEPKLQPNGNGSSASNGHSRGDQALPLTPIEHSSGVPDGPLSASDLQQLEQCEIVIARGWATFLEVGRALGCIRERRLYRSTHKTFEAYCRERHEFSKTHANRLISAAAVVDALAPIGVRIENEAQARPLAGLTPEQLQSAGRKVLEQAGQERVTARNVQEAVWAFGWHGLTDSKGRADRRNGKAVEKSQPALELVGEIEQAVKAKSWKQALQLLTKLRGCLGES